jgi:hypothetical protein
MRKIAITLLILVSGLSYNANAQVTVNNVDLNTEVEMFEVWAFKKAFSTKESLFINYGQDKFRPHYYDHKTQRIFDDEGNYFKKGSWMKLYAYLKKQGWKKTDERKETIGEVKGRVITFERIVKTE